MRVTICEMELSEKAHHADCGWTSCIDGWLKEMICRHPMPGLAESRCFRCFATSVLKILKGKCKGLTYEQCLAQQPQYCTWLLRREKSVASEYQGLVGFLRVRLQASEEAVLANLEETSKGKMSEDKGRLLQAGWICRFTQRRNWCPRQRGCGLNTATEKAATDGYVAMQTGFAGWSIEAKNYARPADGHGSSGRPCAGLSEADSSRLWGHHAWPLQRSYFVDAQWKQTFFANEQPDVDWASQNVHVVQFLLLDMFDSLAWAPTKIRAKTAANLKDWH